MSSSAPRRLRERRATSRRRIARTLARIVARSPLRGRSGRRAAFAAALLFVLGAAAWAFWPSSPASIEPASVAYSQLSAAIAGGQASEVRVEGGSRVVATLRPGATAGGEIAATVPSGGVRLEDMERWSATGAVVRVVNPSFASQPEHWIQAIALVAGIVIIVVLFVGHRRRSGADRFEATPPSRQLTLQSVGGAREAQADLRDVIAYLQDPERFRRMGARCPKGVLLIGPPGTGKTLLARAVAGEAGCPMIMAAGSDFNEMYVGVGAKRVRALADKARAQAPCIVFVDEFDSLGGRRGRANRSGEEEVTLNQLLVEMDGMQGSEGVIWMAATNREDMLDPAVRRPGRFDRVVEVPLPTAGDRLEILKIHAQQAPLAEDVDLERLAGLTVGHSGAELANLLNEAAIVAVQERSTRITNAHLEQARDKILLGRVRSGVVVTATERRLIAIHESGHAVVGMVACPDDKLHKVTIEPRGRSLGAAHFAPEADRHLYPRHYLEGIIAKALGGRAAEMVFLGHDHVTSGAGSDLVQATNIARRMVAEFGMSGEVGLVSAAASAQGGAPSSHLMSRIDTAVQALLAVQMERAEAIVLEHRAAVEALAEELLQREVLNAEEVYGLAEQHGVPTGRQAVLSVA